MNIIITSNLKTYYPELALPTIRSYCSNITKVLNLIESTNVDDLYLKYEKIIDEVKKEYPEIGTRKCKYSSCVVYIKTLLVDEDEDEEKNKKINAARTKYNIEIDIIKKETIKKLSTFEKTKHEEDSWLSNEEQKIIKNYLLKKVEKNITNLDDLIHFRNAIIFIFYLDFATRCEVSTAKIVFDNEIILDNLDKQYNYIILNKTSKTINYILNQHKNANRKGSYTVSIDNKLYNLFSRYRNEIKKFKIDDWFVFNDKGEKNMSYQDLATLYSSFGSIINRKISIRVNRKIYTSEKVKIGELTDLSHRMGHSLLETILVYSKK
jgi:hypothetical protein